jgi:hypothetical protein
LVDPVEALDLETGDDEVEREDDDIRDGSAGRARESVAEGWESRAGKGRGGGFRFLLDLVVDREGVLRLISISVHQVRAVHTSWAL